MTGELTMRDGENEAFIVDRYLESLLARRPADTTDLAPELRATAAVLAAGLPRYHPSFRFEESLAARLGLGTASADAAGELIPFPAPLDGATVPHDRPVAMRRALDLDHIGAEPGQHLGARRPRLVVGEIDDANAFESLAHRVLLRGTTELP